MTSIDAQTSPTTDPKKPTDPPSPATEYVVLVKDEHGWKPLLPHVTARSSEQAVREGSSGKAGTYIAIPSRSWKPVKVSVETVSRVKLEDA